MEQLRTHMRKLNTLHPAESHNGVTMVQLYEKGYGKDAAGIAMEAINYGMWLIDQILLHILHRKYHHSMLRCVYT